MRTEYVPYHEFQKMLDEIKRSDYKGHAGIDPHSNSIIVQDYTNGVFRISPILKEGVKMALHTIKNTKDAIRQLKEHEKQLKDMQHSLKQTQAAPNMKIPKWAGTGAESQQYLLNKHAEGSYDEVEKQLKEPEFHHPKANVFGKTDFDKGWEACVDKIKECPDLDALTQMKLQTYLDKIKNEI